MILEALAQRPGVVKTRNQLLDIAYHDDVYVDDRTIDSHIKRMGLMMLGAAKGDSITIHVSGVNAEDALEKLATLVEERFGEE